MKKLIHLLLAVSVVAALAFTLWTGFKKHNAKPDADEAPESATAEASKKEEEKPEEFVVKLDKEKAEALGLKSAELQGTQLTPHRMAFGRVLDPTPLITLNDDLAVAEAALAASRAENERTQRLLAGGEATSRKAAEAAEAQFRADQIKVDGLSRRLRLEWGSAFATLDASQRKEFAEHVVNGDSALVRVDTLPGDAVTDVPKSARLLVLGREDQPVETEAISPAADTDPKTQAQGFLLRVDRPPFPLRPGMALTAWLELAGEPRKGFVIPRSAILRHDGRTWVYVLANEEEFERKPVELDSPVEQDKGWFVAAEGSEVKAADHVVVTGGESLLSEEFKAQGGGGKAD